MYFIHLFHIVITYPVLNVLISLYQYIHNFSLAIILLACIAQVCLNWPNSFLSLRISRARQMLAPLVSRIQTRYRYDPQMARMEVSRLYKEAGIGPETSRLPIFLYCLNLYVTCGVYFALVVLGNSSLQELNGVLYPFVPHLSALPDYEFSFLGQTISLVRPGVMPWFMVAIALVSLGSAYLSTRPPRQPGCTLLSAALSYPFAAGIAIAFALLFAAGTFLYGLTGSILGLIGSIILYFTSTRFLSLR